MRLLLPALLLSSSAIASEITVCPGAMVSLPDGVTSRTCDAQTPAAGIAMAVLLNALMPNYGNAEQVSFNDPDIKAQYAAFPSPQGHQEGRGYLVAPSGLDGKAPTVLVPLIDVPHKYGVRTIERSVPPEP